jgi:Trans-aconitate methyltransferase
MTEGIEHTVVDLYRRHGAAWARLRGESLPEREWLDRFCALLPAGAEVLDIGCGAGVPIARHLAARKFIVTGLDAAPEMLAMFRRNLPGSVAVLGDMRQMALGRRFSGLLAWDSFFHLCPDDQRGMFQRFADHAAPGAALMFTSGPGEGSAIGELQGEPLYHSSLGPDEYRDLLHKSGFHVVEHIAEEPVCQRTIWLARRVQQAAGAKERRR